jgi:putative ABC transport system permease protein
VALGVGALTGVRGFSEAFRYMLVKEARTLLAADMAFRVFALPTEQQVQALHDLGKRGVEWTQVSETFSMVTSPAVADPLMISVKAVDPNRYPFYGTLITEPAARLTSDSAFVAADVLDRLRARVGDEIVLGGEKLRIAAVITAEPDRMTGSLNIGPRVMITREALERTGLLRVGSRAVQRFLFRVPANADVSQIRRDVARAFPEARIIDYRESHPMITNGLDRATMFLSLVTLIALIVGAIGVGTAMYAHVQGKLDSIAVMKSVGARSSQVIRIYVLQTLMLGLLGGALGVLAGLAVQAFFPVLIRRYFQISPEVSLNLMTAGQGLLAGVLTTLLFTLPPLLGIREVKPNLVLRRDVEPPRRRRIWTANVLATILIVAAVFGLALWLGASVRIARTFVIGLVVSLIALAAAGWLMLRVLRFVVARWPLSATMRHGFANVYRPGSHATAVLTALGVGVMFTLTIYLLQGSVLADMRQRTPPGMPNVFLIDIAPQQREAVLAILKSDSGLEKEPAVISTVMAKFAMFDGKPINPRWSRPRAVMITPEMKAGEVSVAEETARDFGLRLGSVIVWDAFGRQVTTRVARLHKPEFGRLAGFVQYHAAPGSFEGLPSLSYAAARVRPGAVPALQRRVYDRYPTVTVINTADVIERLEEVVDQIALVIRFISVFAIIAGITILASSIAGTRFRRLREVVILKTLGATRRRIVRIFSTEFLVLGAVAGLMGTLLASGFSLVLVRSFLRTEYRFDLLPSVAAVVLTALVATATGWLASFRILERKPLEILRDE